MRLKVAVSYLLFFSVFILISKVSAQRSLDLGLQRDGLVHTLSASYLNQIAAARDIPKDFLNQEKVSFINSAEAIQTTELSSSTFATICPKNNPNCEKKQIKHFVTYQLIHPLIRKIPDHLVLVIPGFGSQSDSGTARLMIQMLTEKGFAVAAFDSPPAKRFVLNSSRIGMPGWLFQDASDLLEGIKVAIPFLESQVSKKFHFKKISLVGTSLGGLNVLHIQLLNQNSQKPIDFSHVISINPPIRNQYSLTIIDQMILENKKANVSSRMQTFSRFLPFYKTNSFPIEFLREVSERLITSSIDMHNARQLIGFSFGQTVTQAASGVQERNQSLNCSDVKTFHDFFASCYLKKYRYLSDNYSDLLNQEAALAQFKLTELNQKVSTAKNFDEVVDFYLEKTSPFLLIKNIKNPDIYKLITFADDFLITDLDATWVKSEKYEVFPVGGHLGGYYRNEFQSLLYNYLVN